ncbi:MAG TPA: sulfatase-like hydrolase/transferase, partial [Candidatus Deferrimicrobium sp.]|nr:sulfatase-like hydrolase/transferase [Candidatus Deferrimicrobium sp.]
MHEESSHRTTALRQLLPSRPFAFLLVVYGLALLFLSGLRLLFAVHFRQYLADTGAGEIIKGFLIGVRFDQIVVLFLLLPLILVLPWADIRHAIVRRVALTYVCVVFSLTFLLSLVDIRFYSYFQSHLNFMAADYVDEGPVIWDLIVGDEMFLPFVALWVVLTLFFAGLVLYAHRRLRVLPQRRSRIHQIACFLLAGLLTFAGIRGRASLAPIDWGVAYFSQNQFLNQVALNGVYTLGRAILEEQQDPRLSYLPEAQRFPFVPLSQGLDTVRIMLDQSGDEWLEPSQSLWRHTHQDSSTSGFRPNVVLVLMESWSAQHTGALGSTRGLTPHFDPLASEGILFTNFYANGIRTNYGLAAALCSFPSLPGRSVMKRYHALHPFRSLSEILRERGYRNVFMYGGDLAFDNM